MNTRRMCPPLLLQPSLTPADQALIRELATALGVRVTIRERGAALRFRLERADEGLPLLG